MALIPEPENSISSIIYKKYEENKEPPRPHMGCSQLGHPCDRWLWLSFRWAVQPVFNGRILRLFSRGKDEEKRINEDLRTIGMVIFDNQNDQQTRVDFGAHVSGSIDAIIESGVPESPMKRHIAEYKTHSTTSFDNLEKNGVKKSKFEHFVQMQTYMHGTKIDRALYVAVCKNDDRIYTERIKYDKEIAQNAIERGRRIALSDRMPEPISTDPSWYHCRFCPAHKFCHETKTTEHVNCRTCAHGTAKENSTWRCERHHADGIPVDFQREGCESHVLHPDLVPWKMKDSNREWCAVYEIDGKDVTNGEGDAYVYTSKELLTNPKMCAAGNKKVEQIRSIGGRIVE